MARRAIAAFLAITAAAGAAACGRASGAESDPAPSSHRYPPPDVEATVLDGRGGWTTYGWLSRRESLCVATVQSGRPDTDLLACTPAPEELLTPGPPAVPARPLPQLGPTGPRPETRLFVGAVRGPAVTVEVTVHGQTVNAPVAALATSDGRPVGAYAAWLPTVGHPGGYRSSDITSAIARDAAGEVLARLAN